MNCSGNVKRERAEIYFLINCKNLYRSMCLHGDVVKYTGMRVDELKGEGVS